MLAQSSKKIDEVETSLIITDRAWICSGTLLTRSCSYHLVAHFNLYNSEARACLYIIILSKDFIGGDGENLRS